MKAIKYEIGNNKVVQIQYGSESTLLDVDTIISSWKNAVEYTGAAKPQFRRNGNRLSGTGNRH